MVMIRSNLEALGEAARLLRMGGLILVLANILGLARICSASDDEKFNVNSPVLPLRKSQIDDVGPKVKAGGPAPQSLAYEQPYKSGAIDVSAAPKLLKRLANVDSATDKKDGRVTIMHVLRWGDKDHKTVKFKHWYVFDPRAKWRFYLESSQAIFEGNLISGRTKFRLIYIHLNCDLEDGEKSPPGESYPPPGVGTTEGAQPPVTSLNHAIGYKIDISKQQPQFLRDLSTVLQIITGGTKAASKDPYVGYYSVFEFESEYTTSNITITMTAKDTTATHQGKGLSTPNSEAGKDGGTGNTQTQANDLDSKAYTNEGKQWVTLSFAVPLNSYRDITYSQSGDLLQPKTVNRQNVYVAANFFVPWPVLGGLATSRYFPHPFFGVPIKGQPLRNTMLGFGIGLKWLEPFAGLVFDDQQIADSAAHHHNHLVLKGAFGLNISVDAAKSVLLKSSATATQTKSGSQSKGGTGSQSSTSP